MPAACMLFELCHERPAGLRGQAALAVAWQPGWLDPVKAAAPEKEEDGRKNALQALAGRKKRSTFVLPKRGSGCSAVGSALVWGTRGRGFKSRHSDQNHLHDLVFRWKGAPWGPFFIIQP